MSLSEADRLLTEAETFEDGLLWGVMLRQFQLLREQAEARAFDPGATPDAWREARGESKAFQRVTMVLEDILQAARQAAQRKED